MNLVKGMNRNVELWLQCFMFVVCNWKTFSWMKGVTQCMAVTDINSFTLVTQKDQISIHTTSVLYGQFCTVGHYGECTWRSCGPVSILPPKSLNLYLYHDHGTMWHARTQWLIFGMKIRYSKVWKLYLWGEGPFFKWCLGNCWVLY